MQGGPALVARACCDEGRGLACRDRAATQGARSDEGSERLRSEHATTPGGRGRRKTRRHRWMQGGPAMVLVVSRRQLFKTYLGQDKQLF